MPALVGPYWEKLCPRSWARPEAAYSRPLAQFFSIRTSRPTNNIYVFNFRLTKQQYVAAIKKVKIISATWQSLDFQRQKEVAVQHPFRWLPAPSMFLIYQWNCTCGTENEVLCLDGKILFIWHGKFPKYWKCKGCGRIQRFNSSNYGLVSFLRCYFSQFP